MATKRKAYDEKLKRVVRALEELTRDEDATNVGAPFASGERDQFPLPGLALCASTEDDDESSTTELHFPVATRDGQRIQAAGSACQQHGRVDVAWFVPSSRLELRNARWEAFVAACVDSSRATLGIATAAQIQLSLRGLLRMDKGGTLRPPPRDPRRPIDDQAGVFGTVLVVLPSAFTGGSVAVATSLLGKTISWHPAARESVYDLSYAVYYDHCEDKSDRLTSGTALCLVYDVSTATPRHVPLSRGLTQPQAEVQDALSEYFAMAPVGPILKRFKIHADAWRSISELLSDRPFVYLVKGDSFNTLSNKETKIAQSLDAFCAQRDGQYALYHTSVLRMRGPVSKGHGDDQREVAPLGQARAVQLDVSLRDLDDEENGIITALQLDRRYVRVGRTHALVVQPALIAENHLTTVDMDLVTMRLGMLLPNLRDEAIRYARRVLQHRKPWLLCQDETLKFRHFVAAFRKIADVQLFRELLATVRPRNTDLGAWLRVAVGNHFVWDACAATLVDCIRSSTLLSERVNFITAVVDESSGAARIDQLLEPLLSRHPWTHVQSSRSYFTDVGPYVRLLALAEAVSRDKLIQVASVAHAETLIWIMVPALTKFLQTHAVGSQQKLVEHISGLVEDAKRELSNEPFAIVTLPTHCVGCDRVRSFLQSTETQTTVPLTQPLEHIRDELDRALTGSASVVAVQMAGANVRLTKRLGSDSYRMFHPTQQAQDSLRALLERGLLLV